MKLFFTLSALLMTSQAHAHLRCVAFSFNGDLMVSVYDGQKSLMDLSFGKSKENQAKGLKACRYSLASDVCASLKIEASHTPAVYNGSMGKSPAMDTPARTMYRNTTTDQRFTTLDECRAEDAISAAEELL